MAETVVRTREDRARDGGELETRAGATDVMSAYPDEEDDFEPTVAIGSFDDDVAEAERHDDLDAERAELEAEAGRRSGPIREVRAARRPRAPALTPMGKPRGVTTSEEIDYRPPPANVLEKGRAPTKAPTRATRTRSGASWSRRSATSASRRRSSASSAARTSPATSCGSPPGPRSRK